MLASAAFRPGVFSGVFFFLSSGLCPQNLVGASALANAEILRTFHLERVEFGEDVPSLPGDTL